MESDQLFNGSDQLPPALAGGPRNLIDFRALAQQIAKIGLKSNSIITSNDGAEAPSY
ncbi:MAG: hypothetical protein ABIV51_13590 [Saprospiraceae bacterium]